jgi:hypothetical protein
MWSKFKSLLGTDLGCGWNVFPRDSRNSIISVAAPNDTFFTYFKLTFKFDMLFSMKYLAKHVLLLKLPPIKKSFEYFRVKNSVNYSKENNH